MADRSPLFDPPLDRIAQGPESQIVVVPLDYMPWSARKSTLNGIWKQDGESGDKDGSPSVKNLRNGL